MRRKEEKEDEKEKAGPGRKKSGKSVKEGQQYKYYLTYTEEVYQDLQKIIVQYGSDLICIIPICAEIRKFKDPKYLEACLNLVHQFNFKKIIFIPTHMLNVYNLWAANLDEKEQNLRNKCQQEMREWNILFRGVLARVHFSNKEKKYEIIEWEKFAKEDQEFSKFFIFIKNLYDCKNYVEESNRKKQIQEALIKYKKKSDGFEKLVDFPEACSQIIDERLQQVMGKVKPQDKRAYGQRNAEMRKYLETYLFTELAVFLMWLEKEEYPFNLLFYGETLNVPMYLLKDYFDAMNKGTSLKLKQVLFSGYERKEVESKTFQLEEYTNSTITTKNVKLLYDLVYALPFNELIMHLVNGLPLNIQNIKQLREIELGVKDRKMRYALLLITTAVFTRLIADFKQKNSLEYSDLRNSFNIILSKAMSVLNTFLFSKQAVEELKTADDQAKDSNVKMLLNSIALMLVRRMDNESQLGISKDQEEDLYQDSLLEGIKHNQFYLDNALSIFGDIETFVAKTESVEEQPPLVPDPIPNRGTSLVSIVEELPPLVSEATSNKDTPLVSITDVMPNLNQGPNVGSTTNHASLSQFNEKLKSVESEEGSPSEKILSVSGVKQTLNRRIVTVRRRHSPFAAHSRWNEEDQFELSQKEQGDSRDEEPELDDTARILQLLVNDASNEEKIAEDLIKIAVENTENQGIQTLLHHLTMAFFVKLNNQTNQFRPSENQNVENPLVSIAMIVREVTFDSGCIADLMVAARQDKIKNIYVKALLSFIAVVCRSKPSTDPEKEQRDLPSQEQIPRIETQVNMSTGQPERKNLQSLVGMNLDGLKRLSFIFNNQSRTNNRTRSTVERPEDPLNKTNTEGEDMDLGS